MTRDPYCRGVVLLGLDAPAAQLEQSFRAARTVGSVKGFAVGRTIFGDAARRWLAGTINDDQAVEEMAQKFGALTAVWQGLGE